jgi:4'-phosphopantetheinyl transferase
VLGKSRGSEEKWRWNSLSMRVVTWTAVLEGTADQPKLVPGQIHLWQASVAVSPATLQVLGGLLSSDERERAGRFRFQRDHDSYAVSRGLLRRLLAAYTGVHAAQIQFKYGDQGKPAIAKPGDPSLRFNVSHSGDAVLLGFALDREIGVDIERMREDVDFAGLARSSFSQSERETGLALERDERARLFYEYWTCKEACIKADGRGLSVPLDQFSIVASAQGPQCRDISVEGPGVFASAMRIRILDAMPGYAAAAAMAGTGWDVVAMRIGGGI